MIHLRFPSARALVFAVAILPLAGGCVHRTSGEAEPDAQHKRVSGPLGIELTSALLDGGGGVRVAATLHNQTDRTLDGTLRWRLNGAEQPESASFSRLAPSASAPAGSIDVRVFEGETSVTAEAHLADGTIARNRIRIHGQPVTSKPPVMDGEQADWNDPAVVRLLPVRQQVRPDPGAGPVDSASFSARVMALWSDTHFFIGADVTDDTPMLNPLDGTDRAPGDSLEVYMALSKRSSADGAGHLSTGTATQFTLTPAAEGPAAAKCVRVENIHSFTDPKLLAGRRQDTAVAIEAASKRTERGYFIEAAIPRSSFDPLGLAATGDALGFDLRLNNRRSAEAATPEEVLSWNVRGDAWGDPSHWGVAVILPDPALTPSKGRQQWKGVVNDYEVSTEATKDPQFLTPLTALPEDKQAFASHLPEGVELLLPWQGAFTISGGYGYESPSWTHQTIGNAASANDFFCFDTGMPVGTPIYATAAGKIIASGRRGDSYGNYVVIDHGGGLHSIYAHLDKLEHEVERGEPDVYVGQGDLIGHSGASGTTFAHLHFGLHLNARVSHSGANVGGLAVVPEPLSGYYGLRRGMTLSR